MRSEPHCERASTRKMSPASFQAPCECFTYDVTPAGTDKTRVCFLSTDRNVLCDNDGFGAYHSPDNVSNVATTSVFLWAAAVPVIYCWLLFAARTSLSRKRPPTSLSRALSFLSDGCASLFERAPLHSPPLDGFPHVRVADKPRQFWWEAVEIFRKLVLTGFLALIAPGTSESQTRSPDPRPPSSRLLIRILTLCISLQAGSLLQQFTGVVVALCLFAIELYVQPFDSHTKTFLSLTSGFALVLTLLGLLGLSLAALNVSNGFVTTTAMLAILVAAGLIVLVAAFCVLATQLVAAALAPTIRLVATGELPVFGVPEGRWLGFLSHTWGTLIEPRLATLGALRGSRYEGVDAQRSSLRARQMRNEPRVLCRHGAGSGAYNRATAATASPWSLHLARS